MPEKLENSAVVTGLEKFSFHSNPKERPCQRRHKLLCTMLCAHYDMCTNLDSIFKSRDIALPTKVLTVKATVFPVIMYRHVSWIIKKAKC